MKNNLINIAYEQCFPAFLNSIENSFPANSSPYVATIEELQLTFDSNDIYRRELIHSLKKLIKKINKFIGSPVAGLVGGSFLDKNILKPDDIDIVVFYTRKVSISKIKEGKISEIITHAKMNNIDLSMCPFDYNPIWSLKIACFYTQLYMCDKTTTENRKGSILIDFIEKTK